MSTITAANATQLYQALKVAQAGDTIALEGGSYASLRLFNLTFANDVTITSKDPGNPAIMTDLQIKNSSGLNFTNIEVFVDAAKGGWGLQVNDSRDIHFDQISVHGSMDNNPQNDLSGMSIRNSSDVSVTNSEFQQLMIGVNHLNSDHISFTGNKIHDIQMDGIRGGGSSYVTISNNHFTNFYPIATDHPDAIQFWTTATTTSAHHIVISDNLIERGDGKAMQGVFMGDESGGKLPYLDTIITGNMVVGSLWHGITAGSNVRVLIENNTVLGYDGMGARITLADSSDVILKNNLATAYLRQRIVEVDVDTGNVTIPTTSTGGLMEISQWAANKLANAGLSGQGFDIWQSWTPQVTLPTPYGPGPVTEYNYHYNSEELQHLLVNLNRFESLFF
ncbi:right-handed parallel beta-helix repeat-containing protein [Phenylobacterium sp.]|uniref:right-handed parallel beta-helix repeat-containing protein n=1 Tax=Phenylobacterium sp. TaxID=1871053 RepID=UPI00286C8036|nr:right-handed parallel beta-helix repeat-containing protein [Phenylobacterium sp.]